MGDVSWAVPTVQLSTATVGAGTPAHSWQAVAAGRHVDRHEGNDGRREDDTLTPIDLFTDPTHIRRPEPNLIAARRFQYKSVRSRQAGARLSKQ
jgi:aminobenzoyl-glutamate utilization protein B